MEPVQSFFGLEQLYNSIKEDSDKMFKEQHVLVRPAKLAFVVLSVHEALLPYIGEMDTPNMRMNIRAVIQRTMEHLTRTGEISENQQAVLMGYIRKSVRIYSGSSQESWSPLGG